jgi:hypothetical protein
MKTLSSVFMKQIDPATPIRPWRVREEVPIMPHDRRRPNAMRFLMKTLRARPASRLIHAFRQNRLWIRSAALLSSCRLLSPAWAIWLTGSPQIGLIDLLTGAQFSFSKLLPSNTRFTNPPSPQSATRSLTVLFPYVEQRQGWAPSNSRVSLRDHPQSVITLSPAETYSNCFSSV